jgi:hypothetical protein
LTPTPGEALVARLLAVVAGDAPMSDAARLLTPGVICHMDRFTVRGVDAWVDWVEFIRARSHGQLVVDVERYVTHPDGTISAFGCVRPGAEARATTCQGEARYRVENGRIAEIWTTRGNYEMIFGAKARHTLGWLLVLLQLAVWRRLPFHPRRGARDRAGNETRRHREADEHPQRRHAD